MDLCTPSNIQKSERSQPAFESITKNGFNSSSNSVPSRTVSALRARSRRRKSTSWKCQSSALSSKIIIIASSTSFNESSSIHLSSLDWSLSSRITKKSSLKTSSRTLSSTFIHVTYHLESKALLLWNSWRLFSRNGLTILNWTGRPSTRFWTRPSAASWKPQR